MRYGVNGAGIRARAQLCAQNRFSIGLKAQLLRRDARVLAEETTKGLTEEQKAAVVASFNEGVAKKTN